MTFEEACQIYYINEEIKILKKELCELEEERKNRPYSKAITYSDMPKGCGVSDPMAAVDELVDTERNLKEAIAYNLKQLQKERLKMELFLQDIPDAQMRLIIRLRCVNGLSWKEIGERMGMDRTTASRKFYSFFEISGKNIQKNESCTQCT